MTGNQPTPQEWRPVNMPCLPTPLKPNPVVNHKIIRTVMGLTEARMVDLLTERAQSTAQDFPGSPWFVGVTLALHYVTPPTRCQGGMTRTIFIPGVYMVTESRGNSTKPDELIVQAPGLPGRIATYPMPTRYEYGNYARQGEGLQPWEVISTQRARTAGTFSVVPTTAPAPRATGSGAVNAGPSSTVRVYGQTPRPAPADA